MSEFAPPKATILLLDSDASTRGVFGEALQSAGYLVLAAEDIGVAVDRLSELRPDLLITRPYINGMSGRFAARYLRTRVAGLPVLIVSGMLDDDRLINPNQVEKISTFPKPFTRDAFLSKVRSVVTAIPRATP